MAALAAKLGLTQDERSELLPSGKQAVFANRVHWARTHLLQAGLLASTRRAHFRRTPKGEERIEAAVHRDHPKCWPSARSGSTTSFSCASLSSGLSGTLPIPPGERRLGAYLRQRAPRIDR
jgi:hypothetical protein